jgi:poly(A) polymerase
MIEETNQRGPYYVGNILSYANVTANNDELKASESLEDYFTGNNLVESQEAVIRREKVTRRLSAMLKAWAVSIGTAKGIQDDLLADGGGIQIQIFGSTRLEVQNLDSDMDILCLAPMFISRADFFSSFRDTLDTCPEVDNLLCLPDAYTPVIKFVMNGLSVDLIFASLQFEKLPTVVDILDLRCLKGLDEQSVRSLNGSRVAEWIYKLVPDMKAYRIALRAVKYWAKQRGLYSSILGFLSGVNFAILVASICQQYHNCTPFTILHKFFGVFASWPWPTPVTIRRFEDLLFTDSDGRHLPVWNPLVNTRDAYHLMPIITPAYPAMNSAYNVSLPQMRYIHVSYIAFLLFHILISF